MADGLAHDQVQRIVRDSRGFLWFCTLDDPSTIDTRHRIGIDHIMVETDYPHGDGTWPDTQLVIDDELRPGQRLSYDVHRTNGLPNAVNLETI